MHAAALVHGAHDQSAGEPASPSRRHRRHRRHRRRRRRSNPNGTSRSAPTSSSATARFPASRPGSACASPPAARRCPPSCARASGCRAAPRARRRDSAGGSFDLADGAVAGCARARRDRRLSPGVCVGASLVRLHGTRLRRQPSGRRRPPGGPPRSPRRACAFGVSPRNAVRLAAQVVVPLGSPNFELAGVGHVFEPASIWLRGTLGWELHF